VAREGVEAASWGDDLAGMKQAVQDLADVVVFFARVPGSGPGIQGFGSIFKSSQDHDAYDAESAGRSLGFHVRVLFCFQPVDGRGTTERSKEFVGEGFGPWGEWVPGGDEVALLVVSPIGSGEQAAADEGAQVDGGGAVNRGLLGWPGGGARTGEHDGAAGAPGEPDQWGRAR